MYIPKVGRLPKLKDFSDIMRVEILSLSVTFVYEAEIHRSTLHNVCAVYQGCAVHWGMFSTLGEYHEYSGGYHEYTGAI